MKKLTYSGAMISSYTPVFDHHDSNYDVEEELREANVIRKNNKTDSESCSLWVYFSSQKSYDAFEVRMKAYINWCKENKLIYHGFGSSHNFGITRARKYKQSKKANNTVQISNQT